MVYAKPFATMGIHFKYIYCQADRWSDDMLQAFLCSSLFPWFSSHSWFMQNLCLPWTYIISVFTVRLIGKVIICFIPPLLLSSPLPCLSPHSWFMQNLCLPWTHNISVLIVRLIGREIICFIPPLLISSPLPCLSPHSWFMQNLCLPWTHKLSVSIVRMIGVEIICLIPTFSPPLSPSFLPSHGLCKSLTCHGHTI